MSTKTNFKRISLVAVAALGLGLLTSVPAAKAAGNVVVTVTHGSFIKGKADTTNAATIAITGTIENVNDTISVQIVANGTLGESVTVARSNPLAAGGNRAAYTFVMDTTTASRSLVGKGTQATPTNIPKTEFAGAQPYDSIAVNSAPVYYITSESVGNVGATFGLQVDSVSAAIIAGTYSFTAIVKVFSYGIAAPTTTSHTINLVSAAEASVSDTADASKGFAFLKSTETTLGNGTSTTTDEVVTALATTGDTRAYFYVGVRNAAGGTGSADESLTATVTGVGLVCLQDGSSCGKSLGPIRSDDGDYEFELKGDGSGGTSTVTVKGSVTGASYTKSLTYYAAAAKTITASVFTPVLAISSNDSALAVTAVDASGSNWAGTLYVFASAAADATAVGGSATAGTSCVYRSANSTHYCPITATTAGTGSFVVRDAATVAAAKATSTAVSVTSKVATPASIKLAFNKANYAPGEIGLIIVTPLDADGKGLPATTIINGLASGGISSNLDLLYNGTAATGLTDVDVTTQATTGTARVAGSKAILFQAPVGGGTITLSATGGTGLPPAGRVALTASATVTDNGAAALAAVNALATTVASLRTLITTLTNLVLKIQKKVKA